MKNYLKVFGIIVIGIALIFAACSDPPAAPVEPPPRTIPADAPPTISGDMVKGKIVDFGEVPYKSEQVDPTTIVFTNNATSTDWEVWILRAENVVVPGTPNDDWVDVTVQIPDSDAKEVVAAGGTHTFTIIPKDDEAPGDMLAEDLPYSAIFAVEYVYYDKVNDITSELMNFEVYIRMTVIQGDGEEIFDIDVDFNVATETIWVGAAPDGDHSATEAAIYNLWEAINKGYVKYDADGEVYILTDEFVNDILEWEDCTELTPVVITDFDAPGLPDVYYFLFVRCAEEPGKVNAGPIFVTGFGAGFVD